MKPEFHSSFYYKDKLIRLDWHNLIGQVVPNLPWQQVYAVGDLNGKVPLVEYEHDSPNLPGGRVEPGETVDQAIKREIYEELNMSVTRWYPIGYQHLIEPDGAEVYQLRVYAKLERVGEFIRDPGGGVIGSRLVELSDLATQLGYDKLTLDAIIRGAKEYF